MRKIKSACVEKCYHHLVTPRSAPPPHTFCSSSGFLWKKKGLNGEAAAAAAAENKLLGYKHGTLILNALCLGSSASSRDSWGFGRFSMFFFFLDFIWWRCILSGVNRLQWLATLARFTRSKSRTFGPGQLPPWRLPSIYLCMYIYLHI